MDSSILFDKQFLDGSLTFVHLKARISELRFSCTAFELGDNCIENFNLGRHITGYRVGNLDLRRRARVEL